jgi:hypothetical protein
MSKPFLGLFGHPGAGAFFFQLTGRSGRQADFGVMSPTLLAALLRSLLLSLLRQTLLAFGYMRHFGQGGPVSLRSALKGPVPVVSNFLCPRPPCFPRSLFASFVLRSKMATPITARWVSVKLRRPSWLPKHLSPLRVKETVPS